MLCPNLRNPELISSWYVSTAYKAIITTVRHRYATTKRIIPIMPDQNIQPSFGIKWTTSQMMVANNVVMAIHHKLYFVFTGLIENELPTLLQQRKTQ